MREAKNWALENPANGAIATEERLIKYAQRIQADALRYAANMSGELRVSQLLKEADELDPLNPGHLRDLDDDFWLTYPGWREEIEAPPYYENT